MLIMNEIKLHMMSVDLHINDSFSAKRRLNASADSINRPGPEHFPMCHFLHLKDILTNNPSSCLNLK